MENTIPAPEEYFSLMRNIRKAEMYLGTLAVVGVLGIAGALYGHKNTPQYTPFHVAAGTSGALAVGFGAMMMDEMQKVKARIAEKRICTDLSDVVNS